MGRARAIAARSGRSAATAPAAANAPARTRRVPLEQALGHVLAEPLAALTDLPSFDTSAMDGWAVSGPGPWSVRADQAEQADRPDEPAAPADTRSTPTHGILAGHAAATPLPDGTAVRIATGARIPPDATAVVRSEHARTDSTGHLHAERAVVQGQDIRPRAQECRSGDRLLPAGAVVTPAVLGLAAAAGYDELLTARRPTVDVLVLGDELLVRGLPHDGLIRDALGPMIAPWLRALGADVIDTRRVADDAHALFRAITESEADLILTTGGTAAGPVDHVHPVLAREGAELLVDGVAVRPGHPMLLARLASGRHLVGLPGNPLAAVSGLLTLAEPLLRTLGGGCHSPRTTRLYGTRCTAIRTTPGSCPSSTVTTGSCPCVTTVPPCCGGSPSPTDSRSCRPVARVRETSWKSSTCPGRPGPMPPPPPMTGVSRETSRSRRDGASCR